VKRNDPVLEYSDRAYRVALSNHADFLGTLDYVLATRAKYVVTDNTRGRGVELAQAISERLNWTLGHRVIS
jgi:putative mRNA 3-end processing factor